MQWINWIDFQTLTNPNLSDMNSASVAQSCVTLWDPMDCSTPGFPVLHQLPELAQTPSNHLILCCPLLLLLSIFPSTRIFSDESVLRIKWPKYWSFNFSISLSNEYSGLISFRIAWFGHFAVQGTLKRVFPNTIVQRHQFFSAQLSLWSNYHIYM